MPDRAGPAAPEHARPEGAVPEGAVPERAVPEGAAPGNGVATQPLRGTARARHLWQGASREITARWDVLAVIAAGGAAGSLARWGLATALPHPDGGFPWATFLTNVTGCLLLGALTVLLAEVWPPSRYLRPLVGTGVLGGYTTFSACMLDTRTLLVTGHAATAGAYLAGTLAGGLAAVWAGAVAVRCAVRLARRRAWRQAGSGDSAGGPPSGAATPATTAPGTATAGTTVPGTAIPGTVPQHRSPS